MLILLLGTTKVRVRGYLECALLISRHQPYVSAHCTRWQLTQLLQPVKQVFQKVQLLSWPWEAGWSFDYETRSVRLMYNIEARSCNHCCCRKAMSITQPECVYWYPGCNAHASYCHLWPVRLYNIFLPYLTNGTIFEKKKIIERKICVLIFSTTFVLNVSHSKNKWDIYDKNNLKGKVHPCTGTEALYRPYGP